MYKIFIAFSISSISAKIYKYDITIKKSSYKNWHTKANSGQTLRFVGDTVQTFNQIYSHLHLRFAK